MEVITNPVCLFLVIVVSGYLLGRVEIKSFSLGSSAVIFTAIGFGHFGFVLPAQFKTLGLVLFIYAVGLQASSGFLSSIKQNVLPLTLGALTAIICALLMAMCCGHVFGFSPAVTAGLFTGAMTSTPGLAVAAETMVDGGIMAAYGVSYAIGVVGVILFIKFIPGLTGVDVRAEERTLAKSSTAQHPPITFRHLRITNASLFGKPVKDIFLDEMDGVTVTRFLRKDGTIPALMGCDTILEEGDRIRIVGLPQDLERAQMYLDPERGADINFDRLDIYKGLIVTRSTILGKTLGSLNLRNMYNVHVTHITRNGIELQAREGLRLNMGDMVHVVGLEESIMSVRSLMGNNMETLYTADIITILIGILAGVLMGSLSIPMPGHDNFSLGITGGVLMAGLVFGHVKKTGPMVWHVPATTNALLRELGLLLFLAVVGTSAGATIVETVTTFGLPLVASALVVTLFPMTAAYVLCRWALGIEFLRTLGVLAGGMTSTPGLAAGTAISDSQYVASAYATVYPMALIGMILATKLLIWVSKMNL